MEATMSITVDRLVNRLLQEKEKTIHFFQELKPEDWQKEVYSEGARWRIIDILKHLVTAESGVMRLIVNILDGGNGVPEDFDLDYYNEHHVEKLENSTSEELLEDFVSLRNQTVAMVSSLEEGDLSKTGRHPFLGVAPVEDIVKLMYRHNQIHQRDVRRLVGKRF
jgi:hypothetical protein